jgi:hypothetical protein
MSNQSQNVRDYVEGLLREADPKLKPTDADWPSAMFLLGSAVMGCDIPSLTSALELDADFAMVAAGRAVEAGLWREGECVARAAWDRGGDIMFWMHVGVVAGRVRKVGDGYQLTPAGEAQVQRLLGGDLP